MSDPETNYAAMPGIDPYIDWALGTGRRSHFRSGRQADWLYVLLHLTGVSARDFARGQGFTDNTNNARWRTALHIPLLFIEDASDDGSRDVICPALVREDFFRILKDKPRARRSILRVTLSLPMDTSLPVVPMPVTQMPRRTA